jgi:all-trans-retinol 13,14-reductase
LAFPDFDAIIVGSGLGGLSCGAYLARNGWKILIIEKENSVGGYARSFKRGPYTFDVGLHMLEGVGKNQSMGRFFEQCGVLDSIEFIKLDYYMRVIFPEHNFRIPSGNLEAVVDLYQQKFPLEKDGISLLFEEIEKIFSDVMRFLPQTAPMWKQLPLFPFRYRSLFRVMKKTIKQLVDKYVDDEKLKTLLFANWGFFGLPSSKVNMYPLIGNVSYWKEGAYYPRGGSQIIPNTFEELIRSNNGIILFGEEVTSIITNNGKATGVLTKSGKTFYGKEIISNISAIETFQNLVSYEKFPVKFLAKIEKMEPSISAFSVYLGLDETFKESLENQEDYDILVSETYDQDQDYEWALNCNAKNASFFITLRSNIDDSLAKDNRFVISIVQGQSYDYWKKFENAYDTNIKDEYNKEKDRIAGILIERTEKIIPELAAHIDVIEIATPLTLKRYTNNFNGALYGWANTANQFLPMDRIMKNPIKNLHLCSHWTFPGEGQAPTVACGFRLGRSLAGK